MKIYANIYILLLSLIVYTSCTGQNKTDLPKDDIISRKKHGIPIVPNNITRNIKQDRKGNIWIAAFDGIFRYDGTSFTNITNRATSARFFSVLEDRSGNFWFSSVGSGVYYYDGKSFRNFTTKNGLANDRVTEIYEDRNGIIWFSTESGASRFDGKSFRNFTTKNGLPSNNVNWIMEDKTGKFWVATQAGVYIYDGKTGSILTHNGTPFTNVRTIIEDKLGNIWLGGQDGLWRYNGGIFIRYTTSFVGYIYEDKTGNIWISANSAIKKKLVNDLPNNNNDSSWTISRYNKNSLQDNEVLPELIKTNEAMIFGIMEANDEAIWFGTLHGVYRYDGKNFTDFKANSQIF